jgi:hypothetical protein
VAQPRAGGALQALADESHAVQQERGSAEEREEDLIRFAHEPVSLARPFLVALAVL